MPPTPRVHAARAATAARCPHYVETMATSYSRPFSFRQADWMSDFANRSENAADRRSHGSRCLEFSPQKTEEKCTYQINMTSEKKGTFYHVQVAHHLLNRRLQVQPVDRVLARQALPADWALLSPCDLVCYHALDAVFAKNMSANRRAQRISRLGDAQANGAF